MRLHGGEQGLGERCGGGDVQVLEHVRGLILFFAPTATYCHLPLMSQPRPGQADRLADKQYLLRPFLLGGGVRKQPMNKSVRLRASDRHVFQFAQVGGKRSC